MGYNIQCVKCEAWAPERFIQPFFTDGEYYDLDPECALAFKNEIHGSNYKLFHGEMAQQLLEDFRKWKKGGDQMTEVKGGKTIEQMKGYAKRLSDATQSSAMVKIVIWCHKCGGSEDFNNVDLRAFSCDKGEHIEPKFKTEDLRELGKAIEDYVGGNSK